MRRVKKVMVGILLPAILMSGSVSLAHHGEHSSHHSNYYYCHGHDAHLHPNGVCPYSNISVNSQSAKYYGTATVKKVQKKLIGLGYKCGRTDGVYDAKTKKAIKKYQGRKGLAVNGKINKTLLKKLKISIYTR